MTDLDNKPDNNAQKELDTPEVIDQNLPAAA